MVYTSYDSSKKLNTDQEKKENSDFQEPAELHYGTTELLNALPKLWTRGILYVVICFIIFGLPWAILSTVDETGSAKGRIEPQGATQKIDSQITGSVKYVSIKAGDMVKSGQVIMELDSVLLQPELQQIQSKLQALNNRQSQLEVIKDQLQSSMNILEKQNQYLQLEKMAQVTKAKQNLETKLSNYSLQKLEKKYLIDQAQQQIEGIETDINSAKSQLSIDSNIVQRFSQLLKDGAVSITQIEQLKKAEQESKRIYEKAGSDIKQAELKLQEELNRYQANLNLLSSDIGQAKLELKIQESSYQSLVQAGKLEVIKNQEKLKEIQTQITLVKSEIQQTKSQIESIKLQIQQRIVRSPIDGIIFELPITNPGAVVQPGQRIAQIAPKNAKLILKAQLPSQDSGFLKMGMPVKVKFDAYPFQEYGIVTGEVTWISPDSKISQTPQGNIDTYELEVTLSQQYLQNDNKRIPLTAGQTANAEVIIRQKRIIDFVLDPFKKLQKNGL